VLKYTRRIITPLVSGIVVTLIGLSLIKVGITACGGGEAAKAAGTFGAFEHVGLAALVLTIIVIFNRSSNAYLRMSSIVIGLVVGYIVAWVMGLVDFSSVQSYGSVNIPVPFKYGISFNWSSIIALGLVYLITAIEAYGDITANSLISGQPVEGEKFMKRASGGILGDGVNSLLAGVFNSFPNSIFAQNNGMIQLTGVASRYVGYFIAGMLVLLGLFPAVGLVFSLMPDPVLGGATLLMFGTVAAAGIRIIASQEINRKATLVIAISLSFGLSVELVPEILSQLPETLRNIFSSGITTGGVMAILTNALIRIKED
jgi:xanthine permease XanP